jgi:hypothetical protein
VTALLAAAALAAGPTAAETAQAASAPQSSRGIASPQAASGRYQKISVPGAVQTIPEDITDSGEIVGCYQRRHGPILGFTERRGRFTTITDPVSKSGAPVRGCVLGVNVRGVLSGYYVSRTGVRHGFVLRSGRFIPVNVPGAGRKSGQGTVAVDINDSGVVAGYFFGSKGVEHGFVLRAGHYSTVRDPADGPGTRGTWVSGVADTGTLTGGYVAHNKVLHGFLYHGGVFDAISVPGAAKVARKGTAPECIAKHTGLVVGSYWTARGSRPIGFSYLRGSYRTLRDPAAIDGTAPQCANDSGQIVGIYYGRHGVQHGFEFTPARRGR